MPHVPLSPRPDGRGGLALSRFIGESILIGDDVRITLVGVRGNKAMLLIEAPREIAVDRAELRAAKLAGPKGGAQ